MAALSARLSSAVAQRQTEHVCSSMGKLSGPSKPHSLEADVARMAGATADSWGGAEENHEGLPLRA